MPMSSDPPRDLSRGDGPGDEMELGVLGRPHGIRGAIHIRLHNPDSDAFDTLESVWLESSPRGREPLVLESVESRPKSLVLQLQGVTTREQAEKLTGRRVFAPRSALPPLEEDEYYLMDLVGCAVFLENERIGSVTAVRGDPSVDTMVITLTDGTLVEQPIVPVWVKDVNIAEGRVELVNKEGWIS